ncbi:IucA/IucC family protein [Streptomyces sanyensis]|uniref:IucA/IucC family protein n=2 Tax=Streptomyces sanyensis TaxID=568869 RepID=A0ABP8ZMY7_9ACTN
MTTPMPSTTTSRRRSGAPARLPTADEAVAHTLLNCLLREAVAPGDRVLADGRLLMRLTHRDIRLGVALRRTSLIGAHRFTGPVSALESPSRGAWTEIGWQRLAELVHAELCSRTGTPNEEFLGQVAASHRAVAGTLARRSRAHAPAAPGGDPLGTYLASEQSLLLGHRFHPTPKAHGADPAAWAAYAPEEGARFPLRLLAVRADLAAEDTAAPGGLGPLDRLGRAPAGYRLLPAHPWQAGLLGSHPVLAAALERGDVLDLGATAHPVAPTASVRTVYDGGAFLKFSLDVRITNCVRKNAHYELAGAVALTRLLAPAFADLERSHPGCAVLREPAYRSLALPGRDGRPDRRLLEGFGVIVRDGLGAVTPPGAVPLLAADVAGEYPTGPGHVSHLLAGADRRRTADWWARYTELLIPPVLTAYVRHGIVLEPHLQNVVVCIGRDGMPQKVLFRDLEGVKLLPGHHREALAALPRDVAGPLTYDAARGWDRVVYCLLVNHAAEVLAALADLDPGLEPALWGQVRRVLARSSRALGDPPRTAALLAGAPLPAKANLLTRWRREADRDAAYVRLPSPLTPGGAL